jgi:hypothetical protein
MLGYLSLAAMRIKKFTIGITVADGDGDTAALPQITGQLTVDSTQAAARPERHAQHGS